MQLLLLVESAANMVLKDSALSTIAPRPSKHEAGVASMAVAARKCARWKAAALLQQHVVSVASTVRMDCVSLMAALPTPNLELNVAANTAEVRPCCALWRAAPPLLNARVSVAHMGAEQINVGLQNAHHNQ